MQCSVITSCFFTSVILQLLIPTAATFERIHSNLLRNFADFKFENETSESHPIEVTQTLLSDDTKKNGTSKLLVTVKSRGEKNFDLLLLAIPYGIENESTECPSTLSRDTNLRQNYLVVAFGSDVPIMSVEYLRIFTGCYYLVAIDSYGEKFLYPLGFKRTDYPFYDKKLRSVKKETEIHPEGILDTRELTNTIEVPLRCIKVRAELWEWEGNVENVTSHMTEDELGMKEKKQICTIRNPKSITKPVIECHNSSFGGIPTIAVDNKEINNERWRVLITWTNLSRGPHTYYLRYLPKTGECGKTVEDEFDVWLPGIDIVRNVGYTDISNSRWNGETEGSDTFDWILLGFILVCIIVIAILVYYIFKCFDRVRNRGRRGDRPPDQYRVTISMQADCEKESDKILLMYEKDSPLFMEAMEAFRRRLEQDCGGFEVHDVYAMNEFDKVSELGVPGWVHELLKEGSKIVWIDTPRFRSRFNDEEEQHSRDDFRADAIPYVVKVAMDSFQNPMTQYRRHFVVRCEGFEVQDGDDDPLEVISPRKRYHIPQQLSQLCEDLKSPLVLLEDPIDEE